MRISDWIQTCALPICSDELLNQGSSDVTDILRQQVPALNVQRFTSNDGSVFTRPYSMRGLPPDQTLVLVNGKRLHHGATVQLSNITSIRGSQGPDKIGRASGRDRGCNYV